MMSLRRGMVRAAGAGEVPAATCAAGAAGGLTDTVTTSACRLPVVVCAGVVSGLAGIEATGESRLDTAGRGAAAAS